MDAAEALPALAPTVAFGANAAPMSVMWGTEFAQLLAVLHATQPRRVFEWGAGGSTVIVPRLCPYIKRWHAVEHDAAWAERVRANLDWPAEDPLSRRVSVALVPVQYDGSRESYLRSESDQCSEWDNYVGAFEPGEYDLVIIDGRARNRCVREVYGSASPMPLIVVHDAQRPEYRRVLRAAGARWLPSWTRGQVALVNSD